MGSLQGDMLEPENRLEQFRMQYPNWNFVVVDGKVKAYKKDSEALNPLVSPFTIGGLHSLENKIAGVS